MGCPKLIWKFKTRFEFGIEVKFEFKQKRNKKKRKRKRDAAKWVGLGQRPVSSLPGPRRQAHSAGEGNSKKKKKRGPSPLLDHAHWPFFSSSAQGDNPFSESRDT